MILALALATAGVAVSDITQLRPVTAYAGCIAYEIGAVPADAAERRAKLDEALRGCRAQIETSYADGHFRMNGQPFPKSWWHRVEKLLDAMDADAVAIIMAAPVRGSDAGNFERAWQLADGTIVEVGNLPRMTGDVRVLLVPKAPEGSAK